MEYQDSTVSIEHVFSQEKTLTKEQELFYKRTKAIRQAEEELRVLKEKLDAYEAELKKLFVPFQDQFFELKIQQTIMLADCYDRMKLSRHLKKALRDVVEFECVTILSQCRDHKEILAVFKSVCGKDFSVYEKKLEEEAEQLDREEEFGFSNDPFDDYPESEEESLRDEFRREQMRNEHKQQKRFEKLKQKEEKEKQVEQSSLKEIYRQLLKAYHPDKEQDEVAKLEKTEITKRIIAAYEQKDLYTLLCYEIELLGTSKDRLIEMAKEKLNLYNGMLLKKKQTVESELYRLKTEKDLIYKGMCTKNASPEKFLKKTKQSLVSDVSNFKKQIQIIRSSSVYLEEFVSSYLDEVQHHYLFGGELGKRFYY